MISTAPPEQTTDCALCILGAGIAGLNALSAAADYLGPEDRVVLVDRRTEAGGMWLDTYSYVRLHQPYAMFTAGNIPWEWNQPGHLLAPRSEVVKHLHHCLDVLRARVDLVEVYGHEVLAVDDPADPGARGVEVRCRSADGTERIIRATRVISAFGLNVPQLPPLALSSRAVLSSTPEALEAEAARIPQAPVYVVGGGKTGMDTATLILRQFPGRKVVLISGSGTVFANRETLLPRGAKRWLGGVTVTQVFQTLALAFDGSNEDEIFEMFRRRFAVSLGGTGEQFFFGLMSPDEVDFLARNLTEDIRDYLADVRDAPGGPVLQFRSGAERPIEVGAIVVNCTGHILRQPSPVVPYLSPTGRVLTINGRSSVHFLSTVSAYFLTHLWYLGKLADIPFYALDIETLRPISRKLMHMAVVSQSYMNLALFMTHSPFKVLDNCHLDFDRWYPLPRRMAVALGVMLRSKAHVAHCRASLDKVQARTGIALGPLPKPTAMALREVA